ncbi:Patrx1 thioredoxine encoded by the PaTrx1 gene [Podospora comata]|uniref:Patrx1 thioredoxine encoded by the PaTrx1 protein n=1 Tax=Podospora comata TaxID=48703 RepID=A0ABY6SLS1_PODCO|nr:Patrx1 thioredoxine encoded by the PaTrx1 gene [Podospora comata]
MAEPIKISTLDELNQLITSTKYVILDFWAEWCGPCKAIAPLFAKLSKSHSVPGQLAFAKIDVDASADIAKEYGITALPSFVFVVDGQVGKGVDIQGCKLGEGESADRVVKIRGADPGNLILLANELRGLAKKGAEGSAEEAPKEEEKEEEAAATA